MSVEERRSHGRSPWRDAYEMLALRPSSAPESSVSLSRNAKGAAQFEVTVRGPVAADALTEARRQFEELVAAYPYTNGAA